MHKIKVSKSNHLIAAQEFLKTGNRDAYIDQLRAFLKTPNNGQNEWERGVIEGRKRAYIELIEAYESKK